MFSPVSTAKGDHGGFPGETIRLKIEELRCAGVPDIPARTASANLRAALKEKAYVQS